MEVVRDIFFYLTALAFAASLVSVPIGVTRRRRRKARLRADARQLVEQTGLSEALDSTARGLQEAQQHYEQMKTPSPTRAQLAEGKKMYKQLLELHARQEEIRRIARQTP